VVSMASARVIAGRMVVSRRASIDVPAQGGRAEGGYGQNACIVFGFAKTDGVPTTSAIDPLLEQK
jgi:hypothetical protein